MEKVPPALLFDIKRDSSEDGPGIRTTVFFKGCPLSCVWCQNPESAIAKLGISFDSQRCSPERCSPRRRGPRRHGPRSSNTPCVASCRYHCISNNGGGIRVNHQCCTRCDACFPTCEFNALEPVGFKISLPELLVRVLIDKPFFRSSGGGVTLSGGEPTAQMKFAHHFLKELKAQNIHTAIETCGYFEYSKFSKMLLPYLDLIYFDLKLFDSRESEKYTGKSNELILENLKQLVRESDVKLIPRIPLIPTLTATEQNLESWSGLLKQLGVKNCELLPYNPLFQDKFEKLGMESHFEYSRFMTLQEQQSCVDHFYQ